MTPEEFEIKAADMREELRAKQNAEREELISEQQSEIDGIRKQATDSGEAEE